MEVPGDRRVAVIIEDDDDIRHLLETVLTQAGFAVEACADGYAGVDAVRRVEPTVITLDVNMPGMDGFETAKRIRAFSDAYIVMLTALGEEIDTLQGLEAGADDYITKPFRPRVLRARIEAMLRRPRAGEAAPPQAPAAGRHAAPAVDGSGAPVSPGSVPPAAMPGGPDAAPTPPATALPPTGAPLVHNGIQLDAAARIVTVDGAEVALTRSEFDLLQTLLESGRRVRTKSELALVLRGETWVTTAFVSDADQRGIEVHMGNLRKKLGESPVTPRWIATVRGVGYRLTAPA